MTEPQWKGSFDKFLCGFLDKTAVAIRRPFLADLVVAGIYYKAIWNQLGSDAASEAGAD